MASLPGGRGIATVCNLPPRSEGECSTLLALIRIGGRQILVQLQQNRAQWRAEIEFQVRLQQNRAQWPAEGHYTTPLVV